MGVVFIGLACLFLIVDNILLKGKIYYQFQEIEPLRKKAKIADSLDNLNTAFSAIHSTTRNQSSPETILNSFHTLCNQVAGVFKVYTGSDCSVCIKIFSTPPRKRGGTTNVAVTTLCRDSVHSDRDLSIDNDFKHKVIKNTDFISILENMGKATGQKFLCNNLPLLKGYKNTSFPHYSNNYTEKGLPDEMVDSERQRQWPLPYKSSLVVPIDLKSSSTETFIGYLCVDSPDIETFDSDICYKLLSGISEGIYDSLDTLVKILQNGKAKS